jgi:hypothetical protein
MQRGGRGTGRYCGKISFGGSIDRWISIHLRVKDAGSSLDNADSFIVSLDLVHIPRLTRYNCNQIETKILGVQVGGEREGKCLLLASWNLDIITSSRDITDNGSAGMKSRRQGLQSRQRAPNDSYLNGFRLIVGEVQYSLCRVTIDELHAKDLSIWEGRGDGDGKIGRRGRSLELFFDLRTR